MLEKAKGPGGLSVVTGSMAETVGGVGDSFLRFPSEKLVEWDGGRGGRDEDGEGEEGWVGRCREVRPGGEFGVTNPPTVWRFVLDVGFETLCG